jgi:vitamin B12 transporter
MLLQLPLRLIINIARVVNCNKNLRKYLCLFSWYLIIIYDTSAQQTHIKQDTLKEIEIKSSVLKDSIIDKRQLFAQSQYSQSFSSRTLAQYQNESVAQLLSQQSAVFIKSYGMNSMATLSLRGASAAQSTVLWNGIPILNPALGVADVSLLKTGLFQNVTLQYGSAAALLGSGNIGGALLVDNATPTFTPNKTLQLNTGIGSFGRWDAGINTRWQNKKFNISLNAFHQQARNNFAYTDDNGLQQHLKNAALNSNGILGSVDYNLSPQVPTWNRYHKLYAKIWWQHYNRSIPAALFESNSVKQQQDESLRAMVGWERKTKQHLFYIKAALSKEYIAYNDSSLKLNTNNHIIQYYQEAGWHFSLNRKNINPEDSSNISPIQHHLLLFLPIQYSVAKGHNISNAASQWRPAIALAYQLTTFKNRLSVNAALRQEWNNGAAVPFLPGMGLIFHIIPQQMFNTDIGFSLSITSNIQRTYRIPTLNELYYFPGGNINLKPEQGWSQDLGLKGALLYKNIVFNLQSQVFNRNIKDWIYWLGGSIWTPNNIASVHSRGLETQINITYTPTSKQEITIGSNYAYILSTTTQSYIMNDGSIGKQIPYTPRYSAHAHLEYSRAKKWYVQYNFNYTGYRFSTVDESKYMLPYTLNNLIMGYNTTIKRLGMQWQLQLNNIGNQRYQVINGRPMPGFNAVMQCSFALQ